MNSRVFLWKFEKAHLGARLEIPTHGQNINAGKFIDDKLMLTSANGSLLAYKLSVRNAIQSFLFSSHDRPMSEMGGLENTAYSSDGKWAIILSHSICYLWSLKEGNPELVLRISEAPNDINGYFSAWSGAYFNATNDWIVLLRKVDSFSDKNPLGRGKGPLQQVKLISLNTTQPVVVDLPLDTIHTYTKAKFRHPCP